MVLPASVSRRGATGRAVTVRRPLGHSTRSSMGPSSLSSERSGIAPAQREAQSAGELDDLGRSPGRVGRLEDTTRGARCS